MLGTPFTRCIPHVYRQSFHIFYFTCFFFLFPVFVCIIRSIFARRRSFLQQRKKNTAKENCHILYSIHLFQRISSYYYSTYILSFFFHAFRVFIFFYHILHSSLSLPSTATADTHRTAMHDDETKEI